MSGKPASVARAGAAAGPRVLVYVAEPGAAPPPPPPHLDALYLPDNLHQPVPLPRTSVYRTQIERDDQRNHSGAIYYKPDVDGKVGVYGTLDGAGRRSEYLPLTHKNDDKVSARLNNVNFKRDSIDQVSVELNSAESFQSRIPAEAPEILTYHTRGSVSVGSEGLMPAVHPIAVRHGQNQFSESVTVQSDGSDSTEREVSVGRSYVNYQFLEQSVSHQSIVNQSISILNQQVGVSRGIVSEGESGSAPQLVRTADGVVLAVLPSTVLPQPTDTSETKTALCDSPQTIVVPLGWRRIVNGTSVLYIR